MTHDKNKKSTIENIFLDGRTPKPEPSNRKSKINNTIIKSRTQNKMFCLTRESMDHAPKIIIEKDAKSDKKDDND